YQLYIDSGGNVAFPGGEDRKSFQERCVKAFTLVMDSILTSQSPEIIAMVVHSGTIMALMDCFAVPHRDYFDWRVQNGEGYEAWLDASYYKGADEKSGRWDFSIMGAAKMGNIK
ncbi:MAG: histidine phosphatase family protein, partial [Lachnospiraceae bacterium]|nr:histidine phosphatase family protein [Lachnospiraceae bacterium]